MIDSTNFLCPTDFQKKYDIKVYSLTFYGIISALTVDPSGEAPNKNTIMNDSKYKSFLTKFLKTPNHIKSIYIRNS